MHPKKSMLRVYFRHRQEERCTYAVAAVPRENLIAGVNLLKKRKPAIVKVLIGVARLHPNDRYCKKTGRTTAGNNITEVSGVLEDVRITTHGSQYNVKVGNDLVVYYRSHGQKAAKFDRIFLEYF